ncbi:MAG: MBL fold metallo-hydrolase [Desulfobacterales bacterium]|nr:MBL fold metallo-hydrolase [Desulfobacterales bacterium]
MLELIDLDIESLGYTRFISAWLYKGPEGAFLVDTGPACTVDTLLKSLEENGVRDLDWILLTHIHMDHAGAVGHVSRHFPEAGIVCHERAASHLIDPSRLWEGSRQILGEIAETYGPIKPVPEERILTRERVDFGEGIRVIPTPGHAAHHQSFVFSDWLFCGEVFGVFLKTDGDFYLRPATPPRFDFAQFADSMERLAPEVNRNICFAHYGMYPDGNRILDLARTQLRLWVEVIRSHAQSPNMQSIVSDLKANDPVFARVDELPEPIYTREQYYINNSVRGILRYIQENGGAKG